MSIINGNYIVVNEETKETHHYDNVDKARRKLMELVEEGTTANFVKSPSNGVNMHFKGRT